MSLPKILVIDDQLLNIRLLERKLERSEMVVISSTNGPDGLRLAEEEQPDVILLDVIMPGMSGIEVCRQLKNRDSTKDIPVIFITANTSKEEKIEGLDVGAADYLIKPLELDETLARVRTQLRIIQEHDANIRLTQQLEQSRRQSSIMHLTEGIAHNMNNLLGVMVGYVGLLQRNSENPEKIISNCDRLQAAIKRMTRIVHQLTVIGHFKSLQTAPIQLNRILRRAVSRFQRAISTEHPVTIDCAMPEDYELNTNAELLEASLERLLQNAFESYEGMEESSDKGEVILQVREIQQDASPVMEFSVLDRGKGIDETIRDAIFEPFVSSSSVIGRGMGLTIARHGASCLSGSITIADREGGGTVAIITHPIKSNEEEA